MDPVRQKLDEKRSARRVALEKYRTADKSRKKSEVALLQMVYEQTMITQFKKTEKLDHQIEVLEEILKEMKDD